MSNEHFERFYQVISTVKKLWNALMLADYSLNVSKHAVEVQEKSENEERNS